MDQFDIRDRVEALMTGGRFVAVGIGVILALAFASAARSAIRSRKVRR